jgi:hypothetical protein
LGEGDHVGKGKTLLDTRFGDTAELVEATDLYPVSVVLQKLQQQFECRLSEAARRTNARHVINQSYKRQRADKFFVLY